MIIAHSVKKINEFNHKDLFSCNDKVSAHGNKI